MPARVPPPEIPIVSFLSPNKADQGLIELWNTEVATYIPLDIGAPHPNSRQYPNFRLGKQAPLQSDEKWVIRTWVTDETSPDWFNYALKFGDEDNQFPIFILTYRVPRATYVPLTKGEPLKSLYKLTLSDSGSGYTFGTLPNVIFDDTVTPVDEIAVAHAVVSPDGTISECVLDFGGTGYVENAGFTVEPPIQGNPAIGIGYIQPLTAILTSEQAELYPEDSEFYAQYLKVARIYETIPGPYATNTRIDTDGVVVTVNSRRNLAANIVSGETLVGGVWTKRTIKDDNNSLIADEVIETRAIPGQPILETRIDDNGDITSLTRTLVEASTLATTDVISGGVWTRTYETPVNGSKLVATKTVEVRNTQNELPSFSVSIPNLIPEKFRPYVPTETDETTEIGTASLPTLGANEFARSEHQLDDYTYRVSVTKIGSISLPVVLTNQLTSEEYGGAKLLDIFVLETLGANPLDEGLMVVSSTITDLGIGLQVRETIGSPLEAWPVITGTEIDPRTGIAISVSKQVVAAGATGGVSGGVYTDVKAIDKWRSITIASSLDTDSLPDPVSWETTVEHSFPNTLLSATWLWASASSGCCFDFDMALETEITQGYAGPCRAKVTESFSVGAPGDTVSITQFFPEGYTLGYAWAVAEGGACSSCRASARTWQLPPTLHDAITIAGGVVLVGGAFTSTIPATEPIGLPVAGTLITKSVDVERWRFGVFFRRVTEIYVPG